MAEDENGHVSPNAVNPMNAVSMQFDEVNLVTEDILTYLVHMSLYQICWS